GRDGPVFDAPGRALPELLGHLPCWLDHGPASRRRRRARWWNQRALAWWGRRHPDQCREGRVGWPGGGGGIKNPLIPVDGGGGEPRASGGRSSGGGRAGGRGARVLVGERASAAVVAQTASAAMARARCRVRAP